MDNSKILKEAIRRQICTMLEQSEQILLEKWSRSEEIDNGINAIYDTIRSTYATLPVTGGGKNVGWIKRHGIVPMSMFGEDITLDYTLYNCKDEQAFADALAQSIEINQFSEGSKTLEIPIFSISGNVPYEPTQRVLNHEVEHVFQFVMAKKNNLDAENAILDISPKAYDAAVAVIDNGMEGDAALLAWLIYYSDRHEQDALMNEYFSEMRHRMHGGKADREIKHRERDYNSKANEFKSRFNTESLQNAMKSYLIYGYTPNVFYTMVDKGYKRFVRKMKNIEKHFGDQVKMLKENHMCGRGLEHQFSPVFIF